MERNPSMTIDDQKGVYYCFTCRAGGGLLEYVQEKEALSYGEAVALLAENYGVDGAEQYASQLASADGRPAARLTDEQQQLVEANEAAVTYYQAARKTRAATACGELLRQRGVTNAVAEKFMLGFASDAWDGLAEHLRTSTDISMEAAVAAGLCVRSADGGRRGGRGGGGGGGRLRDRFRERLIIPIHDSSGRVVGFGGRLIEGPKSSAMDDNGASL